MSNQVINSMLLSTKHKIDVLKTGILKLLLISAICGAVLCGAVLFSATILAEIGTTDFGSLSALFSGFAFSVCFMIILFLGLPLFPETLFSVVISKCYKMINNVQFVFLLLVVLGGNLLGILLISLFTLGTGTLTDEIGYYIVTLASKKLTNGFFEVFFSSLISGILLCLIFYAFYMPKEKPERVWFVFLAGLFKFTILGEDALLNVPLFLLTGLSKFSEGVISLGLIFLNILASTLGNVIAILAMSFLIKLLFYKKAVPQQTENSAR